MDEKDIGLLIERCYPRIRRAAMLITGNASDAEDLAQETFLQAMRSWHRFDRRCRVETWLYAILVNLDRKRRRGYARSWRRLVMWFARRDEQEATSPETVVELGERKESLWNAVSALPDPQRQAIVLRFAEGLSYEEVAAVMNCPIGTVKSRLHHGLAALKKNVDRQWYELEDAEPRPSCCGEQS